MLKTRVLFAQDGQALVGRYILPFLGIILCGLLSASFTAAEDHEIFSTRPAAVDTMLNRTKSKHEFGKRQDPFRPIINPSITAPVSRKSPHVPPKPIPTIASKKPNWKLLGIIEGKYGRRAVIQVSPQKQLFVGPGMEFEESGWMIKEIGKGEVLLEPMSLTNSEKDQNPPNTFSLSFPVHENSS